jgi:hypothetical protein
VKFPNARQINPLDPEYKLPSVDLVPATPPKFIKDPLNVSDIDGAHAKKDPHINFETRPSNYMEDIEGTKAKWRHSKR